MPKPNLFSFATSELSQDAFFCWLAAWADPKYADIDTVLHETGNRFITSMYQEARKTVPSPIHSVKIHRQHSKIDVFIVINETHAIIIEDKTNTKDHSNQLIRYANNTKKLFPEGNILKIFLKTGDQASYQGVRDKGYTPFTRKHILQVLQYGRELGVTNDIFEAFHSRLEEMEKWFNAFRYRPVAEWKRSEWSVWAGFFTELRNRFKAHTPDWDCYWNYVPNKGGGFMGCWFSSKSDVGPGIPYWQFEADKLKIKICCDNSLLQKKYRTYWYKNFITEAAKHDVSYVKPTRFGQGTYMTVAVFDGSGIKTCQDGTLDLEATLQNVITAQEIIQSLINTERHLALKGQLKN